MMPEEKEKLLTLFSDERCWCTGAEARSADGEAVCYNDEAAVAWDVTGALCHLFDWPRACVLFEQFDRHMNGKRVDVSWPARDAEMDAMSALQDFNDRTGTTFDSIRKLIESMPTWNGNARRTGE